MGDAGPFQRQQRLKVSANGKLNPKKDGKVKGPGKQHAKAAGKKEDAGAKPAAAKQEGKPAAAGDKEKAPPKGGKEGGDAGPAKGGDAGPAKGGDAGPGKGGHDAGKASGQKEAKSGALAEEKAPTDRLGFIKYCFTRGFVFIFSKTNAFWKWLFRSEGKGVSWPQVLILSLIIFVIVQGLYYMFSGIWESFRRKSAIGRKLHKLGKLCDRFTAFLSGSPLPQQEERMCVVKKKNDPLYYHVVFMPSETQETDDVNPALRLIAAAIDEAECSIDGCLFVITNPDLSALLTGATARNIRVRLILDNEACKLKGNNEVEILKAAGVKCYVLNSPFLMHHKFIVIDGRITIISSFNWTKQGLEGNCENVLITNDPRLSQPYHREFMGILKDVTEFTPKTDCPGADLADEIAAMKKTKYF